jgi:septal ring factor EnvC (AmiA/AmiB activator)
MTRANQALVVLVVAVLGLWGCAQRPGHAGGDRLKAVEAKLAQLEEDYRVVTAARDQVRKKLADVEAERSRVQRELEEQQQNLGKERDDLKQQLSARSAERDALQGQFENFRKGVRSLLNQADTAATSGTTAPVISTSTETAAPGKS